MRYQYKVVMGVQAKKLQAELDWYAGNGWKLHTMCSSHISNSEFNLVFQRKED